jgi:hypothetical protein
MTKIILTIFFTAFILKAWGQLPLRGTFVGLESMSNYQDPAKPNYKWYHLSVLTFKGDSVFLDQSPIAIYKKDTLFSTSDGGFYYYKGILEKYQGKTIADLTLDSCFNCPNQALRFTPPKLVREDGEVSTNYDDTVTRLIETTVFENPKIKYKVIILESTKNTNNLLVNRSIYRRQKK